MILSFLFLDQSASKAHLIPVKTEGQKRMVLHKCALRFSLRLRLQRVCVYHLIHKDSSSLSSQPCTDPRLTLRVKHSSEVFFHEAQKTNISTREKLLLKTITHKTIIIFSIYLIIRQLKTFMVNKEEIE